MPPKIAVKTSTGTKTLQNIKNTSMETKKVSVEPEKKQDVPTVVQEKQTVKEDLKNSSSEDESDSSSDEDSDSNDDTLVSVEKSLPTVQKVVVQTPIKNDTIIPTPITKTILFSFKTKDYSFLSNFYCVDLNIDGKLYYHVEGYYQSRKFAGTNDKAAEHIRFVADPIIAKKRGRSYIMDEQTQKRWDERIKTIVMNRAVFIKFTCSSDLTAKLLDTGDAILKENNLQDAYWGIGTDGKGRNEMGKLLMRIRQFISESLL